MNQTVHINALVAKFGASAKAKLNEAGNPRISYATRSNNCSRASRKKSVYPKAR